MNGVSKFSNTLLLVWQTVWAHRELKIELFVPIICSSKKLQKMNQSTSKNNFPSQILWPIPINYYLKVNSFFLSVVCFQNPFSSVTLPTVPNKEKYQKTQWPIIQQFFFQNCEIRPQLRGACNFRFSNLNQTAKSGKNEANSLTDLLTIFHWRKNTGKARVRWIAWSSNSAYYFRFTQWGIHT